MLLRFISVVLLLLFTTLVATELEFKNCFDSDGAPVSGDTPCDPTANVSSCCGYTWICATNLYCRSPNDSADNFVGTCTDRTWKDPACPFIQNSKNILPFNYTLNTTLCDDLTICPSAGNTTCCDAGEGIHEIIFRQQQEIPTNPASLSAHYAAEGYSLSSASSTNPASTSATASASGTGVNPTTSSGSRSSPPSAITSSAPAASTKGSVSGGQLSKGAQIALATVVPALALIVGAGTWWETARRNRTKKAATAAASHTRFRTNPRALPQSTQLSRHSAP